MAPLNDPAIQLGVVQLMKQLTRLPHSDLNVKEYTPKFCDDTSALMFTFKNTIGNNVTVLVGKNILQEAGFNACGYDNLVGYAFCPEGGARTIGTILTFVVADATKLLTAFARNIEVKKQPIVPQKNVVPNKTVRKGKS